MNKKNKESFKLNVRFELAYEVISYSVLIILIGLAYIFASNLLAFNWYTVIFGVLAIFIYFLKTKSYLLIEKDALSLYYFYFFKKKKIDMKAIDEFIFYASSQKVEIRSNNRTILVLYLKDKNKKKLLDWLVQHYPSIPCLFFNENETIG